MSDSQTIRSQPRRTKRAVTVVGLALALAICALEGTVVTTAMPTVIGDLGGSAYQHYCVEYRRDLIVRSFRSLMKLGDDKLAGTRAT
jgi:hypothetical protein